MKNTEDELYRIQEMESCLAIISKGNIRNEISDYLDNRREQVAILRLQSLMTEEEVNLFSPFFQARTDKIHDNDIVQKHHG